MKLPSHLTIQNGHLHIAGHDCVSLAETYGTPLYVTSEDRIRDRFRNYHQALSSRVLPDSGIFCGKGKRQPCHYEGIAQLGAGADVFSSGELLLALEAGIPAKKLLYNGSSKTKNDLALAVQHGVKISVDSLDELHRLDGVARKAGKIAEISFRVNPALEVPTHPKIATGLATSKFGIPYDRIPAAYKEALSCKNVETGRDPLSYRFANP